MVFGFFARVTEDPLKHHCHVSHQINGIVMYHHLPRKIDIFFRTRFLFDRGLINCRRPRISRNKKPHNRHDFFRRHLVPKWLSGHIQKANIRHRQFKPDPRIAACRSRHRQLPASSSQLSLRCGSENFFLRRLHSARIGFAAIVKTVQMQESMHNIKSQLTRQRIPEHASLPARCLCADKDFSVLKRQHVC